jgi:glycosyltransferase involved in cell wall biosynthesis
MATSPRVALLYDDSAYVETLQRVHGGGERPMGLVGRQVAGREFLDAYLCHGNFDDLLAVVWNQASTDSLMRLCREHSRGASSTLRVVGVDQFLARDAHAAGRVCEPRGSSAAAPILYTPCPPDPSFAWMRRDRGPAAFALSGVTHTLCTLGAVRVLCELLTAPFEAYDALICTSTAVVRMVRAVTDAYAGYLGDRFGCTVPLRPHVAQIPLGVNPERFRPPTPEERARRRAELNIRPEAVAVLFVGRFTPHAKAHPFPMLQGLAQAARTTGQPVHLLLSGWAADDDQMRLYLDGVRAFAPGIPVSVVNGLDPDLRFGVWHAADVFTSLADSIQETFGLVMVEAMACGLPVVATDWDGYRDLVVDGETGLLVPTCMLRGATEDATLRLMLGVVDYDAFLAECNQGVAVDVNAAAFGYGRLVADPELRRRLGEAGRRRVLEQFTWHRVVKAYEQLWGEQDAERQARLAAAVSSSPGLPWYPAPEISFAGYPTLWLADDDRVVTVPGAVNELPRLLALSLCTYAGGRVQDEATLHAVLEEAASPRRLGDLVGLLRAGGITLGSARATLAWMLKYGVLRRA